MKKTIAILLTLTFLATGAFAFKAMRNSVKLTASAVVSAVPGYFHGILFSSDSNYDGVINVYDNATTANGRRLMVGLNIKSTSTTDRERAISFDPPVPYFNGLYYELTATNGDSAVPTKLNAMVYYNTEK